ncbi:hypothetical protein JCM11491_000752 [Sporobolomyces phaffii]
MPYFSNLQLLLTGVALTYCGYSFAFEPSVALGRLERLLVLFGAAEFELPLSRYSDANGLLAGWGVGLLAQGYFYLMSVYTNDEKFKRNSVPGRFILAFLCHYLASSRFTSSTTSITASLLRLFGVFNLSTGAIMGLSIGFQDGNQVDIDEEMARKRRETARQQRWKTRENELLGRISALENPLSA